VIYQFRIFSSLNVDFILFPYYLLIWKLSQNVFRFSRDLFKIIHHCFYLNQSKYHQDLDKKSMRCSQDPVWNLSENFFESKHQDRLQKKTKYDTARSQDFLWIIFDSSLDPDKEMERILARFFCGFLIITFYCSLIS